MRAPNPFLARMERKKIGEHGRVSEKRMAKKLKADLTPASGAGGTKGDMKRVGWRMEAKATIADSMSVKLEWLQKIAREASNVSQYPAISVSFVTENGHARPDGDWIMIPAHLFDELDDRVP